MVRSRNRRALIFVALVAVAVGLGLTMRGVTAVGGTRSEGLAIPLRGATSARVELEMDSGELRLGRGASHLLDAAFSYNVDFWEPESDYQVISREGVLRLEQGDSGVPLPVVYGDTLNIWDVVMTPQVPVDLALDLGSADATLLLGGFNLLGFVCEGSGGDVVVDLSGPLARDLDVHLATGGGDLTLTLPTQAGVRVVVASDGGAVRAADYHSTGAAFVNERYGTTPLTLTVTVETDGGDVTLLQAAPSSPEPTPI